MTSIISSTVEDVQHFRLEEVQEDLPSIDDNARVHVDFNKTVIREILERGFATTIDYRDLRTVPVMDHVLKFAQEVPSA